MTSIGDLFDSLRDCPKCIQGVMKVQSVGVGGEEDDVVWECEACGFEEVTTRRSSDN